MARVALPAGAVVTDDPAAPSAPAGRQALPPDAVVTDDPSAGEQPTIGRGEAAAHTFTQGGTLGFSDELRGVGGVIGEGLSAIINQGRLPTKAELRAAYKGQRDTERQGIAAAREAYPVQSVATEIAGGLLVPVPGAGAATTGVKAVGIGARALRAAKALAPAAAAGAVAGVGYQESAPTKDLRDVITGGEGESSIASPTELVESALGGAATGAAVAGGLKVVGKGLRRLIPKRDAETIKRGIVDQLAEAEGGPRATPTAQKRVSRAADAIMDEVVKGPDGELVHEIIQSPSAKKGLEKLEPLLDQVETAKQAHYDRFQRAGQHVVDVPTEVGDRLKVAERAARAAGDSRTAGGLAAIRNKLTSEAELTVEAGDEVNLRWLRKQVTTLQDAAADALGGLNEHERSRFAKRIAGEAKDVLDEVIDSKAAGRTDLAGAAGAIRRLNRRQYALLSIQDVLQNRAEREAAKPGGPLAQMAKKIVSHGAVATAGAALGGAPGAALGIAAPIVLKKADRWLNARALEQLRAAAAGQGPGPSSIIRSLATELQVPERQVRAAYLRLISSEPPKEATGGR